MASYQIAEFLRLIPRPGLERSLRDLEDENLEGLADNIYALEAGYRLLIRTVLRHGRIAATLPERLLVPTGSRSRQRGRAVISCESFRTIRQRLFESLRGLATARLCIQPPADVQFCESPDLERARRSAMYSRQVDQLERIISRWHTEARYGYSPRRVLCVTTGETFPSANAAARWVRVRTGAKTRGSHIRTAIKRGLRTSGRRGVPGSGLEWAFDDSLPRAPRPTSPGSRRAVHCVELERRLRQHLDGARVRRLRPKSHGELAPVQRADCRARGTETDVRLRGKRGSLWGECDARRATVREQRMTAV